MKLKPKPVVELAVIEYKEHIRLTPMSSDAKEFILSEAHKYGKCLSVPDKTFSLAVSDGYDVHKVAEYFKSYND